MQLINTPIRLRLAAACCSVVGSSLTHAEWTEATYPAPSPSSSDGTTSFDLGLLSYQESDGRVKALEPLLVIKEVFPDESAFSLHLTLDTLSGASPNGALPSKSAQTFSSPSGAAASTGASVSIKTARYQTVTAASGGGSTTAAAEEGEYGEDDENGTASHNYTVPAGQLPLDPNFRDERKAVSASYTYPWITHSKLTVGGAYSTETDFKSYSGNMGVSQDILQKNTTLSASVNFEHDEINPSGGTPVPMSDYSAGEREADQTKTVTDWVVCTGLIPPDTLMRDNRCQPLRCQYESEAQLQTIPEGVQRRGGSACA